MSSWWKTGTSLTGGFHGGFKITGSKQRVLWFPSVGPGLSQSNEAGRFTAWQNFSHLHSPHLHQVTTCGKIKSPGGMHKNTTPSMRAACTPCMEPTGQQSDTLVSPVCLLQRRMTAGSVTQPGCVTSESLPQPLAWMSFNLKKRFFFIKGLDHESFAFSDFLSRYQQTDRISDLQEAITPHREDGLAQCTS